MAKKGLKEGELSSLQFGGYGFRCDLWEVEDAGILSRKAHLNPTVTVV